MMEEARNATVSYSFEFAMAFRNCMAFVMLYVSLCGLTSTGETLRRWPHWLLSPWGFLIPAIRSGRAVFNREIVKRQSMSK